MVNGCVCTCHALTLGLCCGSGLAVKLFVTVFFEYMYVEMDQTPFVSFIAQ